MLVASKGAAPAEQVKGKGEFGCDEIALEVRPVP